MKAVVQRVNKARIEVKGRLVSEIGNGLMILLGVAKGDTEGQTKALAEKCARIRIFEDQNGKFNLSLLDIKGEALVASQFTLLADTSRGRRPSFVNAEAPERAEKLYELFITLLNKSGVPTKGGIFGERMNITLENRGPVTIILEE
ncbi:MAG TPA: D-tyrosyl-tRNA(Tyr) deacylase [candidate division WOR-3 bacterium]|uniref:D-aminoacyl-tRNA deacylase n=1 Tax=candidate division WOR-3 bacterium TaxID=2052148 RepID=A0A9C9K1F3_UNCW3|nr:D-tyrosyl-tRNA(Tyr) deacylase [candidate division WOR-3 bacterium]